MASEVKDRLLEYLRFKGVSQVDFCRSIGVSSTYIGAMRRSVSDEKLRDIRRVYPDLNTDWLVFGEGTMLSDPYPDRTLAVALESRGAALVPLIPTAACAGSLQDYADSVRREDCQLVVAQVRGAEMAIRVSGDSMEPDFRDGTLLFLRRIHERSFIPWGHPLVVDTANGAVLKCLYPLRKSDEEVEARSLNPAYPPFRIPTSSIYGIYRILGSLTLYSTF